MHEPAICAVDVLGVVLPYTSAICYYNENVVVSLLLESCSSKYATLLPNYSIRFSQSSNLLFGLENHEEGC